MEVPVFVQWILLFIISIQLMPVNNLRTATMDIVSGRAMAYHQQMEARYQMTANKKGTDVVWMPLSAKPKSVFFSDIEPDQPQDWKNSCTSDYFYLRSLNLTETAE